MDSLALRLAGVLIAGLVALQLAIALAVAWPDGRPVVDYLVSPRDTATMARALEAAPPQLRPLIVQALNSGAMKVELEPGFPPEQGRLGPTRAPRLERLFERYAHELDGRPFRVQARRGGFGLTLLRPAGSQGPVRLLVRLKTGQVLVVERAPAVLQRLTGRSAVIAAAALAIMLAVLLICLWSVRPVAALARAARGIGEDIRAPDVPLRGVREVRALTKAMNEMKHTIRGLLDDRTRILAAIAHDMRTYLTRLQLRSEFITDPEQQRRAVADLDEMGQLLDDTLLFARDATQPDGRRSEALDVRAQVAALAARRREMGEPVEDATAPGDPLAARVSVLALRRILDNLVDNAVRYGGVARLRAWGEAGAIAVAVEDDGPGAAPEALTQMTLPFARLEPSRGRGTGGAGLGLAIVKALAESQGGAVTLENRLEGGFRVVVRLAAA